GRAIFERSCDIRYRGQGYELNLRFGRDLIPRFHSEHQRRYGYSSPEREIEIVTVRLRARVPSPEKLGNIRMEKAPEKLKESSAKVWFSGKSHVTPIMPRESLKQGKAYRGPGIITEYSATTVVPPGYKFHSDKIGNLIVEIR
ncbi:MAG TPA: hydantoinase/oxoprolinase family protein, partial [Candidatus Angelobacter sp.]|nr:hydantoinase/oxoprolinase family protein [Candidatus Angelobacter sp.]